MESSASRSARVKLQLRDKKGRWIEMGSKLKWIGSDGKNWHGTAVGQTGQNVNIEVDGQTGADGGKKVMLVNRKKVEVIQEKASLNPTPKPAGDNSIPAPVVSEEPKEDAVAPSKFKATPTPTSYVLALQKAEDGPLLTPMSQIKVGDKVYPIVAGPKPYAMATSTSSVAVQKFGGMGVGTVTGIKDGKYAVVEGADGKKYFPSLKHNAFKATPETDAAIVKAMDDEKKALTNAGIPDKPGPEWVENLKKELSGTKATLPEPAPADAPEPEQEKAPEVPAAPAPQPEPVVEPQPEPQPEPAAEPTPIASKVEIKDDTFVEKSAKPLDISKWKKKSGTQMGSNPGGIYTDESGKEWYVKHPQSNDHAMNEVLADDLYKAAGVPTSNLQLADLGNGKLGTASPMLEGVQKNLKAKLNDPAYKAQVQDGFAMDVLLANWDVAGLTFDNIVTDKDGKPVRVDPGGALIYRAQGSPKGAAFGNTAGEWETLRDGSNAQSAALFGDMSEEQLAESVKKVEALTPEKIAEIVDATEFSDKVKASLKTKLTARREDILAKAPKAQNAPEPAAEPAPEVTPDTAPEAPATPEPTPDTAPEPAPVPPSAEPVEEPAAPAPAAPEAPAEAPAPQDDPFAGVELKDKGKTIEDANGATLKVGSIVTHGKGKNGKGIVITVLPSTSSAKVHYENGVEQVATGKLLTTVPADGAAPTSTLPEKLSPGEVFFDTATGKTHIGSKDGTPIAAGDKVSYTKKGVTQEGTVKGIYTGQQTVSVNFDDGSTSTKKASVLQKLNNEQPADAPAVDAPEKDVTPEVTPDETPAPEVTPEAPAAPEEAPAPDVTPEPAPEPEAPEAPAEPEAAPAEPATLDGKENPTKDDLNALPTGAKLVSANNKNYVKTEDGKWAPEEGNHGPYSTNMMADGDGIAHGFKVDLNPAPAEDKTPEATPEAAPEIDSLGEVGAVVEPTLDQLKAAPAGATLTHHTYGTVWKKDASGSWDAYYPDGKAMDLKAETDDLISMDSDKAKNQTLDLSPEAPAEAGPDLPALQGKKLGDITKEQLNELPIGSKLVSTVYNHYWQKIEPKHGEDYQAFDKSTGQKIDVTNKGDKIFASTFNKDNHVLDFSDVPGAADAPAADAPDVLADVNGKLPKDLSAEQIDALPVGTKAVAINAGHYWQLDHPGEAKPWQAYGKASNEKSGVQMATSKLFGEEPFNTMHTMELPSDAATEKAPDAPATPEIVAPGSGDDAKSYSAGALESLPVGTKIVGDDDQHLIKGADGTWSAHITSWGDSFPFNHFDNKALEEHLAAGQQANYKVELPNGDAPSDDAPAAEAPETPAESKVIATGEGTLEDYENAPIGSKAYFDYDKEGYWEKVESDVWHKVNSGGQYPQPSKNFLDGNGKAVTTLEMPAAADAAPEAIPTKASDLPVGSFVPARTGSTVGFKKLGENEWTMTVYDKPVGEKLTDSFVQAVADETQPEVTTPDAPEADSANSVTGPYKPGMPEPQDLLPGSTITSPNGTVWTKGVDGKWSKPNTAMKMDNDDMSTTKLESGSWTVNGNVAEAVEAPSAAPDAPEASDTKSVTGQFTTSGYHAEDFMPGSKLTAPSGNTYIKGVQGKWNKSGSGTSLSDEDVNGVSDSWTVDGIISVDPATPATPSAGVSMPWAGASAPDAKWLANGSKISMGTTEYVKTGEDTWTATGTGYTIDSAMVNTIKDNGWTLTLPGDADSNGAAEAAPEVPSEPQIWSDMSQTASELPVGTQLSSPSMKATKSGPNEWTNDNGNGTTYSDSQVDAVKSSTYTTWKMQLPNGTAASEAPAAAPAAQKAPIELGSSNVHDLPNKTVIVNTAEDYALEKNGSQWKPINKDGSYHNFKDGEYYAAYYELYDGAHFNTNSWNVFAPGEDWKGGTDASATPANPHVPADYVGVKHTGMTTGQIATTNVGAFFVSDDGYVLKKTAHDHYTPVSENSFKDGSSYAVSGELASGGQFFPSGNWTIYEAPAPKAASGEAAKAMDNAELEDLPDGTVIYDTVHNKTYKKMTPPGYSQGYPPQWVPLDASGSPVNFDDGSKYATSGEISSESNYKTYSNSQYVINPTSTETPTTPNSVPTGPIGSAANPAKVSGVLPTKELLEHYPTGTTMKKEGNFASSYYFVKLANGNWEYKKNANSSGSQYTSDNIPDTFFKNGTTATVHQPKPWTKHAVLGTGEIVYAGDAVYYKGDVGYIASITDAGKISVQVNGKKGYKAASTLQHDLNYGKKSATATAPTATPSAPAAPAEPSAPSVANFAGASADAYNADGATFKGIPVAPNSGLSVASTGEVNTSNPLYGAEKPQAPQEPETGKWDSAAWLKAVEQRYLDNPNKAKSKVQDSNNWNTIENVLAGQAGSLDKLLASKYIDQKMYDDAKAGIAAHEASIKSVVDAHKAKMADFQTQMELWQAANPSDSQFKDAEMPNVSDTPFTGGEADWSKAPVGTYTADAAIAAVKKNVEAANRGASVATDSSDIEDLAVKFKRRLDLTGSEVIEANFKVTPGISNTLFAKMKEMGASQSGQIWLPKFQKDQNSGLMKDVSPSYSDSMSYSSGKRLVWTDAETGAKVIFQRTNEPDSNNTHTLNNSVRILMPKESGSAEYQKVLEKLGITAKPSTAGDIKVFAENKFITVFKGKQMHEYKKNLTGAARTKALQEIKAEYGLSPEDLYFGVDGNGDTKLFFTDEAAEKLQQKTKVDGFYHNLSDSSGDAVFAMITGANPGLNSTYQRWSNGIHKSGMSSSSDIGYGSGDFMYTKVSHNSSGKAQNAGTVFINPKAALKRLDIYGNSGDNFGKKSTSSPSPYELMKGNPYEIMFKHTVPLSEWSHVTLSGGERAKLIERLKEHGITKINGIPLENFILTSGMDIPQIDPSVYSASAAKV